MISLPDFKQAYFYENNFYLSCATSRIGKLLAHYELYKKIQHLNGAIVEAGVFKGASFSRFGMFRDSFEQKPSRKLIGFDTFGSFPETAFKEDKKIRNKFIQDAGAESISTTQLHTVLKKKHITNVDLVAGDIIQTVPAYMRAHPKLKIALLNLDTDIYEPAVTVLKYFYPCLVKGGILILDDYDIFPGETKAVDDYFKGQHVKIQRFSSTKTPCYIVKK